MTLSGREEVSANVTNVKASVYSTFLTLLTMTHLINGNVWILHPEQSKTQGKENDDDIHVLYMISMYDIHVCRKGCKYDIHVCGKVWKGVERCGKGSAVAVRLQFGW